MTTPTDDAKTVHELLREARDRAGLTQTQVADKLGRKQQTVAAWEAGTRHPNAHEYARFMQICEAPRRFYTALADVGTLVVVGAALISNKRSTTSDALVHPLPQRDTEPTLPTRAEAA